MAARDASLLSDELAEWVAKSKRLQAEVHELTKTFDTQLEARDIYDQQQYTPLATLLATPLRRVMPSCAARLSASARRHSRRRRWSAPPSTRSRSRPRQRSSARSCRCYSARGRSPATRPSRGAAAGVATLWARCLTRVPSRPRHHRCRAPQPNRTARRVTQCSTLLAPQAPARRRRV